MWTFGFLGWHFSYPLFWVIVWLQLVWTWSSTLLPSTKQNFNDSSKMKVAFLPSLGKICLCNTETCSYKFPILISSSITLQSRQCTDKIDTSTKPPLGKCGLCTSDVHVSMWMHTCVCVGYTSNTCIRLSPKDTNKATHYALIWIMPIWECTECRRMSHQLLVTNLLVLCDQ